jgi:hypothetical protein
MGARQRTRAWVVIGPSQGRYGLRGLGDGDGEAEGLDLPDVVLQLAGGTVGGLAEGANVPGHLARKWHVTGTGYEVNAFCATRPLWVRGTTPRVNCQVRGRVVLRGGRART